jgi:hypothetical protein
MATVPIFELIIEVGVMVQLWELLPPLPVEVPPEPLPPDPVVPAALPPLPVEPPLAPPLPVVPPVDTFPPEPLPPLPVLPPLLLPPEPVVPPELVLPPEPLPPLPDEFPPEPVLPPLDEPPDPLLPPLEEPPVALEPPSPPPDPLFCAQPRPIEKRPASNAAEVERRIGVPLSQFIIGCRSSDGNGRNRLGNVWLFCAQRQDRRSALPR